MGGVIEMITPPFFMASIRGFFFLQAYGGRSAASRETIPNDCKPSMWCRIEPSHRGDQCSISEAQLHAGGINIKLTDLNASHGWILHVIRFLWRSRWMFCGGLCCMGQSGGSRGGLLGFQRSIRLARHRRFAGIGLDIWRRSL